MHLFLPLFAAIIYVVAALLLKRASDLGADVWRSTRIINYTQALMAVPFWLLGGTIPSSSLWWQPVIAGLLFFAGQVFTLLALTTGDVSVATPVLGLKIVLAALGAAAYASFDVLVQKFSPVWGTGRFLPLAMACGAAYSLALPTGRHSVRSADLQVGHHPESRPYAPWLAGGAMCFAVQGLMFMSAVSIYRQVTSANVLYSSRGLWSVVGVWAVGHWFTNREQHLGARVLVWRFIGAILLLAAIVMVLLNQST